ncbi:TonB-dependent receptor [Erythrobacter sp. MTPC3]|uniref:TonB-dependent receptor n=1 Tax=Erythrobacter sp. MTPC3 TaxID=3056564 RepID=UPI0036F1B431
MRKLIVFFTTAALAAVAAPAAAQDLRSQEIVVTASRIDNDDFSDYRPAVGLRREADFLVQQVIIRGDTRDADQREEEIRAMLFGAIRAASGAGVELAQGNYIVTQVTEDNADELELSRDRRPDSEFIRFLVKAPLADTPISEAQARIEAFVEAVPEVGRAQMDISGDGTLSVVGPDNYRDAIIAQIAADSKRQADTLGDEFTVELTGLNMPVQWARSGPGEVLLFIPYEMKIVPRR